ncbi:hypothetical protein TEK04_19470 [Klenkia sp. LSe6-5]|uniref:DnaJ central domain-containing protein n=1 Tax=Klenkia sesuvii TaxID=3103137 RepID=A0ABU8DYI8_9ACTN
MTAPVLVECPGCGGHGRTPAGRFAPVADYECERCQGRGRVPADELAEEQP